MDHTLFTEVEEASHAGDVCSLKELLKKDKLLLEKVIGRTSVMNNPLHIAAMAGHADFVREVIYHKPELANELNDQGLSPLHLAAAHGHVDVVKELLKQPGLDLCLVSEKQEGLLPLHIAVKKRRTVIIKELVEACGEAVHRLTNGGETILHLAVKYNSFDTVEFLIDWFHNLNLKDDRGNTILHYAVASKQLPVLKFLLSKKAIDVNAMNLKLSTPLDVLLDSWPQNGDLILGEMIRAAGGKTAAEVQVLLSDKSEPVNIIRDCVSSGSTSATPIPTLRTSLQLQQPRCLATNNDIKEAINLELQKKKKEKKYDPQILLLVATLVATVTFQAALNPPGGVQPDDKDHENSKGQPVLGPSLFFFEIFDMFSLFSSVSVMLLLLCAVPRKKKIVMKLLVMVIWAATFSMGMAFTDGIGVLYFTKNYRHWLQPMIYGWLVVLRLGISWVLIRFFITLLKECGLWDPIIRLFASLKRGCFFTWQQFSIITKINGSICCHWFKRLICIVLILGVLAGITIVWVSYMYIYM